MKGTYSNHLKGDIIFRRSEINCSSITSNNNAISYIVSNEWHNKRRKTGRHGSIPTWSCKGDPFSSHDTDISYYREWWSERFLDGSNSFTVIA